MTQENLTQSVRELQGTKIIASDTGNQVGTISDVMLDPTSMDLAAIVISEMGSSEKSLISFGEISKWENDAIFVKTKDAFQDADEQENLGKWRSVVNQILKMDVQSSKQKRIGKMNDVLVSRDGHITAFDVTALGPELQIGKKLTPDDQVTSDKPELEIGQKLGTTASTKEPELEVGHPLDKNVSSKEPELEVGHRLGEMESIRIPVEAAVSFGLESLIIREDYTI